jgi:16S rRNA (adenine1518-N6/adenine1519-N6)-dimethyltransferase
MKTKKIWGQHWLKDVEVIEAIAAALPDLSADYQVLEVGPGMGVLTNDLLTKYKENVYAVEVDPELYEYLIKKFPELNGRLFLKNFLQMDLRSEFPGHLMIAGNFPYNISSQIVFKILDNREQVTHMLGMFQKEVALRIASPPGSKEYGILSVLTKAFYDVNYLFEVSETAFQPPPKVKSAVISLTRNNVKALPCNEKTFKQVVKAAFGQRRKMLRNSLKGLLRDPKDIEHEVFTRRPEQMSLEDFIDITLKYVQR